MTWGKRKRGGSGWVATAKRAKVTPVKKKPFYSKTTVYKQQPDEMKRASRDSTLVLGQGAGGHPTPLSSAPFKEIDGGSTAYKRIGNQINARGLRVRGTLRNKSANTKTMMVRIIYLYNRRVENALTDASTLFLLKAGQPASCSSLGFDAMYLPLNNSHFEIVSDETFKLGSSLENGDNCHIYSKYIKLNNLVKYDDAVGDNINMGNLQVVAYAYPVDGTPTLDTSVQLSMDDTVYYTD